MSDSRPAFTNVEAAARALEHLAEGSAVVVSNADALLRLAEVLDNAASGPAQFTTAVIAAELRQIHERARFVAYAARHLRAVAAAHGYELN